MMTQTNDSDSEYETEAESAFEYFVSDDNISGAYNELARQVANKQRMAANAGKYLGYYLEKWQSRGGEGSSPRLQS